MCDHSFSCTCVPPYYGSACEFTRSGDVPTTSGSSSAVVISSSNVGLIVGLCVGLTALAVLLTVLIVILMQRALAKRTALRKERLKAKAFDGLNANKSDGSAGVQQQFKTTQVGI